MGLRLVGALALSIGCAGGAGNTPANAESERPAHVDSEQPAESEQPAHVDGEQLTESDDEPTPNEPEEQPVVVVDPGQRWLDAGWSCRPGHEPVQLQNASRRFLGPPPDMVCARGTSGTSGLHPMIPPHDAACQMRLVREPGPTAYSGECRVCAIESEERVRHERALPRLSYWVCDECSTNAECDEGRVCAHHPARRGGSISAAAYRPYAVLLGRHPYEGRSTNRRISARMCRRPEPRPTKGRPMDSPYSR